MAGVAWQTVGVLLVMARLRAERPRRAGLLGAYAAFALAVCVKQHFLATAVMSTGLLAWAGWRGRVPWGEIAGCLSVAAVIVVAVYSLEWLVTDGRIGRAAVEAMAAIGRFHPADWLHVATVFLAVLGRSPGLIALGA